MPRADENSCILEIGIVDCFTRASHFKPLETSSKGTKRLLPILRTTSQHLCQKFVRAK